MEQLVNKKKTLQMSSEEFKSVGTWLIDKLAEFLEDLPGKKVTTGETPGEIQAILGNEALPNEGRNTKELLEEAYNLLTNHSLFNGHPRFWGYITSSAAPIGALADMLAATINPNVGAFALSPIATEIERKSVKWLSEFIGFSENSGGLFVSGGNMANMLGFLTASKQMIPKDIRKDGLSKIDGETSYLVYCSKSTHTWIHKAVDLFGFGTDSIRWIPLLENQQMNVQILIDQVEDDLKKGHVPFLVVANAGSVSTGAIDRLEEISAFCKSRNIWFHIDGAYGAPAAVLPELAEAFKGLSKADSIAIDPHKWLYAPLEAGCILVRNEHHLLDTFSFTPEYYNFRGTGTEPPINFFEYGIQNSRGFKALKVWLILQSIGRNGMIKMIRKDIELSKSLFELIKSTSGLEAISQNLSITTFRYIPKKLPSSGTEEYINQINEELLNRTQKGGEVFVSNAIINEKYCLRACIVNFNTTYSDLEFLIDVILREGEKFEKELFDNY